MQSVAGGYHGVQNTATIFSRLYGGCIVILKTPSSLSGTIFAYGQTSSGKTHTMEGYEYSSTATSEPKVSFDVEGAREGLMPQALHELFAAVDRRRAGGAEGGAGEVEFGGFAPPLVHFPPDLLRNSAPLLLKRQRARTPGRGRRGRRGGRRVLHDPLHLHPDLHGADLRPAGPWRRRGAASARPPRRSRE